MPNHPGPMACPVDGTTLAISERSGIEIDYCPACRGVWLDRGELDKILASEAAHQPQHAGSQPHAYDRREPRKRRRSFLEELFD